MNGEKIVATKIIQSRLPCYVHSIKSVLNEYYKVFDKTLDFDGHFYQGKRHFGDFMLLRYPASFLESFPKLS